TGFLRDAPQRVIRGRSPEIDDLAPSGPERFTPGWQTVGRDSLQQRFSPDVGARSGGCAYANRKIYPDYHWLHSLGSPARCGSQARVSDRIRKIYPDCHWLCFVVLSKALLGPRRGFALPGPHPGLGGFVCSALRSFKRPPWLRSLGFRPSGRACWLRLHDFPRRGLLVRLPFWQPWVRSRGFSCGFGASNARNQPEATHNALGTDATRIAWVTTCVHVSNARRTPLCTS